MWDPSDRFEYRLVCDLLSARVPESADAAVLLDAVDAVVAKGDTGSRHG